MIMHDETSICQHVLIVRCRARDVWNGGGGGGGGGALKSYSQ